ncbi:MAG: anaerobic ribonucleoside triphosphate reductase, partial [Firmicutes bacterium]|nr:anaerobic ribonucleoside triphosphate reductase [Bacillota bacterium]
VPVYHTISIAEKIAIEGQFHRYCDAGHISYVELPAPPLDNPEAVEAIVRHMRKCDVGYGGINYPVDVCGACGHTDLIPEERCPACGGGPIRRVRRITGYLSTTDRFNAAKLAELRDRKVHRMA